jgi:hypothetical protein
MRAVQKVKFPISFLLKDFCIELASMGSVSTYIHHYVAVVLKFAVGVFPINWLDERK